ncbi:MAG TPA: hypothetical protein VF573_27345 [Paraburkholderia sp.]|uniref:hypothetical protein n=1 Tax=Paraburkholderia sp. TaxID=1926495 RepID=UPI002ED051A4
MPLLIDAITDETLGQRVDCSGRPNIVIYAKGTDTTSSGVITIEECDYNPAVEQDYTGTWSSIATVNASDVTGGAQKAVHLALGAYGFVRARISTAIGGGGSVSVVLRAS